MKVDSQFVDNYVATVREEQPEAVHDEWVQERLTRDFMHNARATLRSGSLAILLTALLLYSHVSTWGLIIWVCGSGAMMIYRAYSLRDYDRLYRQALASGQGLDVGRFFARHGWSWPVSGVWFAFPVFLFNEHTPQLNQYFTLLLLVGIGALSASLMSARLQCQRQFANSLCATILAAVAYKAVRDLPQLPSLESWVFLAQVVLFWVLILYLGKHLHHLQSSSYSAQFGNEQLIRSLRQQTQAATDAVQMKNNLLASATHDLRQPVHALAFYADWLRNEPQLASSVLPKILAATDSVNTLFNSLFDFARIESGAIQVHIEPVSISMLVEEMALQFMPAAQQKGLYLRTQTTQAMVMSDPVQLRRITANLLSNAIRYTEQGGVTLNACIIEGKLWLEVTDTGKGIASEHLPYVFKEFYRAPSHQGTADSFGLGLAIVQRLAQVLGHVVTIRSEVGKGTCCRVELALCEEQPQITPIQSTPMHLVPDCSSEPTQEALQHPT